LSNSDAVPGPGLLRSHGAHPGQERRWRSGDSVCGLGIGIENTCRLLCRWQSAVLCSALQGCYPPHRVPYERLPATGRSAWRLEWGLPPATRAARTALRCPSCSGEEILADLRCRSWRVEPGTRCLSVLLARCTAASSSGGRPLPFSRRRCTSPTSWPSCWASGASARLASPGGSAEGVRMVRVTSNRTGGVMSGERVFFPAGPTAPDRSSRSKYHAKPTSPSYTRLTHLPVT
jgi:hypothetical protein